mmetsp:Transcript_17004/g.59495  ORF Transcript_17004/g.59495 Transcript_17004/m.59495 type:complete len:445 (+) Transcript_17004:2972-4306(+)
MTSPLSMLGLPTEFMLCSATRPTSANSVTRSPLLFASNDKPSRTPCRPGSVAMNSWPASRQVDGGGAVSGSNLSPLEAVGDCTSAASASGGGGKSGDGDRAGTSSAASAGSIVVGDRGDDLGEDGVASASAEAAAWSVATAGSTDAQAGCTALGGNGSEECGASCTPVGGNGSDDGKDADGTAAAVSAAFTRTCGNGRGCMCCCLLLQRLLARDRASEYSMSAFISGICSGCFASSSGKSAAPGVGNCPEWFLIGCASCAHCKSRCCTFGNSRDAGEVTKDAANAAAGTAVAAAGTSCAGVSPATATDDGVCGCGGGGAEYEDEGCRLGSGSCGAFLSFSPASRKGHPFPSNNMAVGESLRSAALPRRVHAFSWKNGPAPFAATPVAITSCPTSSRSSELPVPVARPEPQAQCKMCASANDGTQLNQRSHAEGGPCRPPEASPG